MNLVIRSQYDGLQDEISHETGLDCSKTPSLTKQSAKDECDINVITKRYEKNGGELPNLIKAEPRYGDFSNVPDYLQACELVLLANSQFDALDARLRARFGNDPAQFLAFTHDERNLPEMIKLGLATEKQQTPPPSQPVPAPATPSVTEPAAGGQK